MNASKTYRNYCSKCKEETPHIHALTLPLRVALRTWKMLIFFISFGLVYPHPLPSSDDTIKIKCSKCLTQSTIACG